MESETHQALLSQAITLLEALEVGIEDSCDQWQGRLLEIRQQLRQLVS